MDKHWHIDVDDFGLLRVSDRLIDELASYRQLDDEQPESGGVLIGQHLNSNGCMVINDFTPPQDTDKQGRCQYYRSKAHSELVRKIWEESNKHSTYVGLWHTHPEKEPEPSNADLDDWRKALSKSKYAGNNLFFVIVGQSHIKCWIGIKKRFKPNIELIGSYELGGTDVE